MPAPDKTYLFRMVHIENIPHILKNGITHVSSPNANPNFVPIGDKSLISRRNNFLLNNGKNLGEYIPFYFAKRTPMLYVIQKGYKFVPPTHPEHIVYCVTSVEAISNQNLRYVFTDGHAIDALSMQYDIADIVNLHNIIDWEAIESKYWKDESNLDLKRKKEAEFLVMGDIGTDAILGYIVYSEATKEQLLSLGIAPTTIVVKPDYYF